MKFNTSLQILIATLGIAIGLFFGTFVQNGKSELRRVSKTYWCFQNGKYHEALEAYRELEEVDRETPAMKEHASDACKALGIRMSDIKVPPKWRDWTIAGGADTLLLIVLIALFVKRGVKSSKEVVPQKDLPATRAQIEMIRRLDHWRETAGLTQAQAKALISELLQRTAEVQKRRNIRLDPYRFMTPAAAARARERDRKVAARAEAKTMREAARAEKAAERERIREQKEEERTFRKREAEQEKLYKLRDRLADGGSLKRTKSEKMRAIQEFQQLMIDVLADNRIEPQEVRRIKAWLSVNSQYSQEFARELALMDAALKSGVITETEQSAIFEATLDCLITLRSREA